MSLEVFYKVFSEKKYGLIQELSLHPNRYVQKTLFQGTKKPTYLMGKGK
jgi:hypothetical protein